MSNWKFINKTYLYDGTFDGLLTIVFNCYSTKTLPQNVENEQNYTNNFLDNTTFIQTDYEKSDRVFKGIEKNICYDALYNSYYTFLSNEKNKEINILKYLCSGFDIGPKINTMLTSSYVYKVISTKKRVYGECHRFKGLLRFIDVGNNLFYSSIHPDNNIIEPLGHHFISRLPTQNFIIHDKNRNILFLYNTKEYCIVSDENFTIPSITENEKQYQNIVLSFIDEESFDPRTYDNLSMEADNTVRYGDRKKYAECVAYQRFPEYNPVSIRPAYVADPFNFMHEQNVRLPEIVDWIRRGKGIKSTNKNYAVCFTRVDEEAELILKLADNSYNDPLNISSIGYVTIEDIVAHIASKFDIAKCFAEDGELPNFPSGINLDVKRLEEMGYVPSKLTNWLWEYVDYYCEFPIENYKSWKIVKSEMDVFMK